MTQAIVFVPAERMAAIWRETIAEYCIERGYQVLSIVSRWEDLITELAAHPGAVTVTGRLDMLKVEAVVDQRKDPLPSNRRPRRLQAVTR